MANRVMSAEDALQKANSLFVDENFEESLKMYNLAIELDDSIAETFVKRSICNYKLNKFTASLSDANSALKLEPNNTKALLRKGMALFSSDEFESAKAAFEKGLSLDSSNTQWRTWIRKCDAELESEGTATTTTPAPQTTPAPTTTTTPTTTPAVTTTPPPTQQPPQEPKIRHEWYQNTTHVIVTLYIKNVKKEDFKADFQERSFAISIKSGDSREISFEMDLSDSIVPSESFPAFFSTKIELKLKKSVSGKQWKTLEDTGEKSTIREIPQSTTVASSKKKNWDKIVDEVAKTEGLDDGDPLNKVFQEIYANGSEEQRRAMMKSFVESGGTVLSTNWDEVGKDKVKGSPPEGMEMHKWDE